MIKHLVRISISFVLAFAPIHSYGEGYSTFLEYLNTANQGPADYLVKRFPNQKLIPVRLIGGVTRPGFYQVPEDTSLLSLISYSGGATATADLKSVTILKDQEHRSVKVNVRDLLDNPDLPDHVVSANDVIYITEKKPLFSSDTIATLTVLSTVAALILSSYAIQDRARENR